MEGEREGLDLVGLPQPPSSGHTRVRQGPSRSHFPVAQVIPLLWQWQKSTPFFPSFPEADRMAREGTHAKLLLFSICLLAPTLLKTAPDILVGPSAQWPMAPRV